MKRLKITLLPAPGGHVGQGLSGQYDQHEFTVDDTFEFDILDGVSWLQFEDVDDTSYAFPMSRIAGLALQEL
jgi:hypothetical protein